MSSLILTENEHPKLGERVLINDGDMIVGARLVNYLSSKNLIYITDTGRMISLTQVDSWMPIPDWI
jgi:chaperone required for assembly of F1-ATPase